MMNWPPSTVSWTRGFSNMFYVYIYIYTKVDDKLTPFNGQLDAWLRSKPAAGPPLSVVNTMIESWTYQYFMMGTCIYANAKEKNANFCEPEACWRGGVPQQPSQRSHQACRASQRTCAGSSPIISFEFQNYKNQVLSFALSFKIKQNFRDCKFWATDLDIAVSLNCIFRGLKWELKLH